MSSSVGFWARPWCWGRPHPISFRDGGSGGRSGHAPCLVLAPRGFKAVPGFGGWGEEEAAAPCASSQVSFKGSVPQNLPKTHPRSIPTSIYMWLLPLAAPPRSTQPGGDGGEGARLGPPRCGPGMMQDKRGGGKSPHDPRTGFPWHPTPALRAGGSWAHPKAPPCRGAAMCPPGCSQHYGATQAALPTWGGTLGLPWPPRSDALPPSTSARGGRSGLRAAPAPLFSPRIFRLRHPPNLHSPCFPRALPPAGDR